MRFFFFFLFSMELFPGSDGIRIFTSRDLGGNIKSCVCTTVPIAGIGGRAAYLDSQQVSLTKDILIETGNYLGSVTPSEKNQAVFEGFLSMGYHFLGLSEAELKQTSPSSWDKYFIQPISTNLYPEKKNPGWKISDAVYRNGKVIRFLSVIYPSLKDKIGSVYMRDWVYRHPEDVLPEITLSEKADLWILSVWGNIEEIEESKTITSFPNKLIIWNTRREGEKDFYTSKKIGKIHIQGGENGDELNIFEYTKDLKFIKKKKIVMDAEKLVTPEKISGILKKYGI